MSELKTCPKCFSAANGFYRHSGQKDGLQRVCKVCMRDANQAWRNENPEKMKAARKQWVLANPEKVRAAKLAAYARNPLKHLERTRRWASDKSAVIADRKREYRIANVDQVSAYMRDWRAKNRERSSTYCQNRRARKMLALERYSVAEIAAMMEAQSKQCANHYCRAELGPYQVDHIVPLSRGGGNGANNLQLLCPPCNRRKHAKLMPAFLDAEARRVAA